MDVPAWGHDWIGKVRDRLWSPERGMWECRTEVEAVRSVSLEEWTVIR